MFRLGWEKPLELLHWQAHWGGVALVDRTMTSSGIDWSALRFLSAASGVTPTETVVVDFGRFKGIPPMALRVRCLFRCLGDAALPVAGVVGITFAGHRNAKKLVKRIKRNGQPDILLTHRKVAKTFRENHIKGKYTQTSNSC